MSILGKIPDKDENFEILFSVMRLAQFMQAITIFIPSDNLPEGGYDQLVFIGIHVTIVD